MSAWAQVADRLVAALGCDPPLAVSFAAANDDAPPPSGDRAPQASCVLWSSADAADSPRWTAPQDHGGCSVGSYVHGFTSLPEAAAGDDTAMLVAAGWITPDALTSVPAMAPGQPGTSYAPLRDASSTPQIVLFTLTPAQLMVVQTAIPDVRLTGKPQCQIIPLAAAEQPAASFGCAVSRARTGLDANLLTCALPGQRLLEAIDAIEAAAAADVRAAAAVGGAHGVRADRDGQGRRARGARSGTPLPRESSQ